MPAIEAMLFLPDLAVLLRLHPVLQGGQHGRLRIQQTESEREKLLLLQVVLAV